MRAALSEFHILGLPTNIPFLLAVLDSPVFRAGGVDTTYLDEEGPRLAAPPPLPRAALAAAAAHDHVEHAPAAPRRTGEGCDPWASLPGWRG
jgi:acetyl/propionyl-CoA carboxylase alpha subunit